MSGWNYDSINKRIYNTDYTVDDLVIGSDRKDDAGGTDRDMRLFFNKAKAAIRAGQVTGTQWDNANVGNNSAAFGLNCKASGAQSFAMGDNNTSSGSWSATIGESCTASGLYAFAAGTSSVAAGDISTAFGSGGASSGSYSFVAGGNGNTASGNNSLASGGSSTAAGDYSQAYGYQAQTTGQSSLAWGRGALASRLTQRAYSGVFLSGNGDVQSSQFVSSRITTDATPTVLLFDHGVLTSNTVTLTGQNTNVLTVPVSRGHRFSVRVIARRTDTQGTFAGWTITGTMVRSSSGDARFISTPSVTADKDAGASAWDFGVSINNSNGTNNYLVLTATGEAAATIRWVAEIDTVEVG